MDNLETALAELISVTEGPAMGQPWVPADFVSDTTGEAFATVVATVLNAVLSGQLIPLETCNARVAAMVEAALAQAGLAIANLEIGYHDGVSGDWHPYPGPTILSVGCAAIRALTPADAQAALDAMISRAREVKPLAFEPVPSEDALCHDHWSAPALGGAYHMAPDEDSPGTWLLQWTIRADDFCMKYGGAITRHSSPEDVHSAAQADYTARIHAALRANATDASEGER